MRTSILTSALICAGGAAHAFCDDILATQVLCLTEEAEEIKICASKHPVTEAAALTLHAEPGILAGPITRLASEIPLAMTPGTGGFPWDMYDFSFVHGDGRAVVSIKTPMDTDDTSAAEIWLDLFGRGTAPDRSLTCMVPALRAEVDTLLQSRGVAWNRLHTGPSAASAPLFQPEKPITGGDQPGAGHCRPVAAVLSNEGHRKRPDRPVFHAR